MSSVELDPGHESPHWWGAFHFADEQRRHWQIGPLHLSITRARREWQLAYWQDKKMQDAPGWSLQANQDPPSDAQFRRYYFDNPGDTLRICPHLADRAVITRPLTPIHLPMGESMRVYLSTPVWLRVSRVAPDMDLLDVPLQRPSDTWFGPSTWSGELCYAARTQARLSLEELPLRAHRAITAAQISNKGNSLLLIERLKLPVRYLSVYSNASGMLWSNDIRIVIENKLAAAGLDIDARIPHHLSDGLELSQPREKPEQKMLVRALETIFG